MSVQFNYACLDKPFEANWPVSVNVPQDGGTIEVQTFDARFRMLDEQQVEALGAKKASSAEVAKAYLVELPGGPKLTDEFLAKFLAPDWVREGLKQAYQQFRSGAPAKN